MEIKQETINRTEFLKKIGFSGAALFAVAYCTGTLQSCSKDEANPTTPTPTGPKTLATIDLNSAAAANLKTVGGFITVDKIVIALTNESKYVAVTKICSHAGNEAIGYNKTEFLCSVHGARFDNEGKGLNANGSNGLTVYKTTVTGSTLTVTA